MTTARFTLLAALPLAIAACATNPVTGREELSLVSSREELAIGQQQYGPAQQSQGGPYYLDPKLQNYVRGIGARLAAQSDRPLPYEFVVLDNPVPNAWALPGGKIAVNSGLLLHLDDEAQLAAVVGHEIVHAAAGHGASQMSKGSLINLGAELLGVAGQQAGLGNLAGQAAQMGAGAWMARYSREAEVEADAYGMDYMVRAGYDPQAAVDVQETFVKLDAGGNRDFLSGLFASHPPSQERVNANQRRVQNFPSGGVRNAEAYRSATAQLRKDAPAYAAEKKALAALKERDAQGAIKALDQAIAIEPGEGRFWELRGHARALLDQASAADEDFTTAIDRNRGYYRHHLARGVARFENRRYPEAQQDLQESRRLLPTPLASLYLGEIAAASGDPSRAEAYYREAASDSGPVGQQARARLGRLYR